MKREIEIKKHKEELIKTLRLQSGDMVSTLIKMGEHNARMDELNWVLENGL